MTKVLAIDLGASSGRAILGTFDGERIALEELHRFTNVSAMINGSLYWDIIGIFDNIKKGLHQCKLKGHEDIQAIAIDTWGVDYGFIDKRGKLMENMYHYRDSRTEPMIAEVESRISADEMYNRTGIQKMPFNTAYQIMDDVVNAPNKVAGAETMLFVPDLLNYFLTGVKKTEYTIASTSALCNPRTRTFDKDVLDALGIPERIVQQPTEPGTICGTLLPEIAHEVGLPQIPVICCASHDTASAVISVPMSEGETCAFISCGTWSILGVELDTPVINEKSLRHNFTNEGGAFGTTRFMKNIMGLWLVQECRNQWLREGQSVTFAELEQQARECTIDSYIDPDDLRFFSPCDMADRVKEYCAETGQRVPQGNGEVIKCVIQSIARRYKEVLDMLEDVTGKKFDSLRIVGGGIKDKLLCQCAADAIGIPVYAGPIEATATGNIAMQLYTLGKLKDLAEIRRVIANSSEIARYTPANV